jgi:hypothetical protein
MTAINVGSALAFAVATGVQARLLSAFAVGMLSCSDLEQYAVKLICWLIAAILSVFEVLFLKNSFRWFRQRTTRKG